MAWPPASDVLAKERESQSPQGTAWSVEAWRASSESEDVGFPVSQVPPTVSVLGPGWDPACRALLPACCDA